MHIGLFLNNLGHNQIALDAIANVNQAIINNTPHNFSLFYKNNVPTIIRPRTLATTFDKLYSYDGHLITTSLDTTFIATKCNRLKSVNFFVNELEWTFGIGDYLSNCVIYKNNNINVFVPSQQFGIALQCYCGITPKVLNGLDINEIIRTLR